MEITVFIPTRGRIGWSKQITLREFQGYSNIKPILVCPEDTEELVSHQSYSKEVWGCPVNGIGPTRQWILENAKTPGVVMLDDDLYFAERETPNVPGKLIRSADLDPMIGWIRVQLMKGFIHGGISARQGNQNIDFEYTDCIRVNNAHFFNRDAFLETGVRFDALPVMEDFYVTLNLLLKGYPNRVAYHYCWNQRGSGFKGGCSLYRTAAVQESSARALAAMFPDYVKVVEKKSDTQHGVMANRMDVNIAWLKAWKNREKREHPEVQLERH